MRTIIVLAASLTACGLFAPKPTEPSWEVADACSVACDSLRSVGCPEANGSLGGQSCQAVCIKASDLRPLPLGCWSRAKDAAEARGCGSLRCVK